MEGEQRERFDIRCIVHSGAYFDALERGDRCSGQMHVLPGFWDHHPSGDMNGYICEYHAGVYLARTDRCGYLRDRLRQEFASGRIELMHPTPA
jgi:hypothetical protein